MSELYSMGIIDEIKQIDFVLNLVVEGCFRDVGDNIPMKSRLKQ